MRSSRTIAAIPWFLASAGLGGQEFEYGISAPEAIRLNSTFEAAFTLTSRGIPAGEPGSRAWSLAVSHRGLQILSVTRKGTAVEDLLSGGFAVFEITRSDAEHPQNAGFVSAVLLSATDLEIALPSQGTATVARATYHVGPSACSEGAGIAFTDGLVGKGEPVKNAVTFGTSTYLPLLASKDYAGCRPNDYRLHLAPPSSPFHLHLGERASYAVEVRLGQAESTASGWSLAVSHNPDLFQVLKVSVQGTPAEALLAPAGFALFEITSGHGNSGFTAQVELDPGSLRAFPAPDEVIVRCEYALAPIFEPSRVGEKLSAAFRFAPSLRGSGGIITNLVFPAGNLTMEDAAVEIEVRPPARFIRGDANADGAVDLSDCLAVLFYLFQGKSGICLEAGNANDDARVDIADAIAVLARLFLDGPELALPSPDCGDDPNLPSLGCEVSGCPE